MNDLLITKKRRIELEGAVNFRDLGGFKSTTGKSVKWSKVYRSDGLSRLTEDDLEKLKGLKIKTIVDFRSEKEKTKSPDKIPDHSSVNYVHLPIKSGEFDYITALNILTKNESEWPDHDFMMQNYLNYVDQCSGQWRTVLDLLAEEKNLPLLFHCTAGKDRTGACAAIILSMLSVAESDIVDDHQASNLFIEPIAVQIRSRLRDQGINADKLEPFLSAPKNAILEFLNLINSRYGSILSYLTDELSMTQTKIEQIKSNLLEDQ